MKLIVSLLILIISIKQVCLGYGESDSSGLPTAGEREQFNLVNLVRMFPSQWKANYMSSYSNQNGMLVNYPAVPPLYYDNDLNKLALSHSTDMAVNNCFAHDSCDGTSIWTRFDQYLKCQGPNGAMAENIAAGADALESLKLLVCDETGGSCANDKSSGDGHRQSIMGSSYKYMGVGHYSRSSSRYTDYWTQDFSDGTCTVPTNPIASGYHTFVTSDPQFIVIFYSTTTSVSTMSLIFADGTKTALSRTYGTAAAGAYITTSKYVACQQYYYEATTADGKTVRYPDVGFLQVSKTTSCAGWVQTGSNVTNPTEAPTQTPSITETPSETPTTEAPTTQAPTTQAPTTQAPTTQAPTTQAPTTQAPTTEAPTTEAPTSEAPTTEAPTTEAPTTEAPTTEAPNTQEPSQTPTTTQEPSQTPTTTQEPSQTPTTTQEPSQTPTTTQVPTPTPSETPTTTEIPTSPPSSSCLAKIEQKEINSWINGEVDKYIQVEVTVTNQGTLPINSFTFYSEAQQIWSVDKTTENNFALPKWHSAIEVGGHHTFGYIIKSNEITTLENVEYKC